MSYILDALKKADLDRERERGAIPGIHAQQIPHLAVGARPANNIKLVLWLIVGLLTVILGALAWRMSAGESPAHVVALAPPVASMPSAGTVRPAPTIQAPVMPQPTPVPAAAPAASSPVALPTPDTTKALPATPAAAPTAMVKPEVKAEVKEKAQKVEKVEKAVVKAEVTPESRIYALAELPEDVQRDLPKLAISGGTYSSNPAQRLLIVNNQVFLENSQPVPGVTVEQIRQNAAVLSFRGYRYRVAY